MQFKTKVLPTTEIKIDGTIKKALDSYKKKKIPMRAMVKDFLAVKSKGDALADAENPWAYFYKGFEGYEVESGVSLDESAFRFAAMSLKNEEPSDVINAAFYSNKVRNDSDFELGYVVPLFLNEVDPHDRVLVVNPTPDMISTIENAECGKDRFYAVTDNAIAGLYRLQFTKAKFYTFDQMQDITDIDAVLLTSRDQKANQAQSLLKCLLCCTTDAKIIGLIPCAWLDNPYSEASNAILKSRFSVKQLLIVDPTATASSPRKKMIVLMKEGTEKSIEVLNSSYDKKSRRFSVIEDAININSDSYLGTTKTILQIVNSESNLPEKKTAGYHKADEYKFSTEISIFYKVYSDRKSKYAGVAYYRGIKDVTDANQKIWGRKLSSDIEKGLRHETKEGVIRALEETVFDENLYMVIRTDIRNKYITEKKPVSLKTIWFYCWIYLSDIKKYDHEYVSNLFRQSEIFSDIVPQFHRGEDILEAIASTLRVDISEIPYKAIEQIDLILNLAVKHDVLIFDPLESYVSAYTSRASKRQQEVRDALVKKHFSEDEEYKIFTEIVKETNVNGKKILLCTKKSLLLAVAIRMFTGMSIREAAALTWEDFRQIEDSDDYQFTITKLVDVKGKYIHHSDRENWKRFRIIPSSRILTFLLNERRQYLIDSGVDPNYLLGCPIILQDEKITDMKHRKTVANCKPEKISSICNDLIKAADIPVNEVVLPDAKSDLVTDFNRYHGDIFLSNFRHKAKHVAFMTLDEISYMTGISAPDTFSRHYCDESNDFVQLGIIQKLRRWDSVYDNLIWKMTPKTPDFGTATGYKSLEVGPFSGGVAEIDVFIDNKDSQQMKVSMDCSHGICVNETLYRGGNENFD